MAEAKCQPVAHKTRCRSVRGRMFLCVDFQSPILQSMALHGKKFFANVTPCKEIFTSGGRAWLAKVSTFLKKSSPEESRQQRDSSNSSVGLGHGAAA